MAIVPSNQPPAQSAQTAKAAPASSSQLSAGAKASRTSTPQSPPAGQVSAHKQPPDRQESSLRPRRLRDYLGQEELKESLGIAIAAAQKREDALDHMLFYGPPGLGKTTISMLIAEEMGTQIRITSAPALERPRDIAGLLVSLQAGDVLFIDEIHRLNRVAEEILYPAMEDFMLDITIGKGQAARIKRLPLKPFTLIGATTKAGSLSSPLRTRFGLVHRLRFYSHSEMQAILLQSAKVLQVKLKPDGALAIARRARGTPRVGNRLLKWVRDYAAVHEHAAIDAETADAALAMRQIDPVGLEPADRQILQVIVEHYQGGPVGVDTLAAAISEDPNTIEDMYEPFLMQQGLIQRTLRGRVATAQAYRHLGLEPPQQPFSQEQLPLFELEEGELE